MNDERPFYVPNSTKPAPRELRPREFLFEFDVAGRRYRCDLLQHPDSAVEVQFTIVGGEFLVSRRFDTRMDPTRTPRAMAVQWAEAERETMNKTGIVTKG